ncbi:MAG TPA: hypothetical protein VGW11_02825 [Solirubrobacteraceae bacterium]|nr:hypothetical protein [Solirubrobacteraceae bacterium]
MLELLAAWVLFPAALGLLGLGLGLAVERLGGWTLPGALLLPVGIAALIALARLLTATAPTATVALPAIFVLAVAGLVLGRARLRAAAPDRWLALAAAAVFVVFAAPLVLSGAPTFTGYLTLPDTSHHLTLSWLYAQQGGAWEALPESSTRLSMQGYVETAYPVGAQAALGVTAPLGLVSPAWLYQPLLAVLAVVAGLALAALAAPWVRGPRSTALVAFLAAQPALLVGFALQGSIKEVAATAMLLTAVAVAVRALAERRSARTALVLAVPGAAMLAALGPPALAYLAPLALAVAALWAWRGVRARRWGELGWLATGLALAVVLARPVLTTLACAISVSNTVLDADATGGAVAPGAALGNLARPLSTSQTLGVWLSGDYRLGPVWIDVQRVLSVAATVAAAVGAVWTLRRRAWGPLFLAAVVGPVTLYLLQRGTPYADAKVLMLASPAVLLLALLGALALGSGRLRWVGRGVLGILAASVLASNALAYHDVSLAPHGRYAELLEINDRLAGRGPVIFNEYDEFAKYFLRDTTVRSQPEWPHGVRGEPFASPNAFADPARRPSVKTPFDLDDFDQDYLASATHLVTRRSPMASRPPSGWRPAWEGDHYGVWERVDDVEVVEHVALGPTVLEPAAPARCDMVARLAARAEAGGARLAYVERSLGPVVLPAQVAHSATWERYVEFPGALALTGPGQAVATIEVDRPQRFRVWIEASVSREVVVTVDGREVGAVADHLNNPGAYLLVGEVALEPGAHDVAIAMVGGTLGPGDGVRAGQRQIGPLVFSPPANERRAVQSIDPADHRELCGRQLDWVEVVRSAGGAPRR